MDINSTLNISLDRDELQNKIRNLLDVVLPDDLSNKLASLVRKNSIKLNQNFLK